MSYLVYQLGKRGGQKRSSDTDLGYYAQGTTTGIRSPWKPMPVNRSLHKYERIRLKDESGNVQVKRIGYSPDEQTIFVDDFENPRYDEKGNPKFYMPKINFKKGILKVDPEKEPLLYERLEMSNYNEDNPNRDPNKEIKFHRVDRQQSAKEALANKEKITKELAVFWDMPLTKKRAIANFVGIPTAEKAEEVWVWRLYTWAQANVDKFVSAYNSQDLDYADYISRAEHMKIIRFNAGEWLYNDVKILPVSSNRNPYEELIKHLIRNPKLNVAIRNDVKAKEGRTDFIVEDDVIDFAHMTGEEMLALAQEKRVVEYKQGHGYYIIAIDKYIGEEGKTLSKKAAAELIDTDELIFEQVKAQLIK